MAKILSQEQVDALLRGLGGEEVVEVPPRKKSLVRELVLAGLNRLHKVIWRIILRLER
jgi:flagellar motor switch protein FliM